MSLLLEKVRQAMLRFSVQPEDKIVVAVSGGPDSVCLLYLLKTLSKPFKLSLHIAHLNHQFRPEADDEAAFVKQLANEWGIPVTIAERPVSQICKSLKRSKQEGARMVRYQFCEAVAKQNNAKWIALGHTADDQAETLLMHLLRGSGRTGLGGIPEKRAPHILRPLLHCTRKEITKALQDHHIPFIEDPSNKKPIYLRNRIRHHLIPILEHYNPDIKNTLYEEAEILQSEDKLIEQWLENLIPDLDILVEDHSVIIPISSIQKQHTALQRRLLRWGIKKILHHLNGIGFEHIESIRGKVILGKTCTAINLPHDIVVKREYSKLTLTRRKPGEHSDRFHIHNKEHFLPEITAFPFNTHVNYKEWEISLKISASQNLAPVFSTCIASFDFDKISPRLSFRNWRPGDRFAPNGMGGRQKKIQDFFVDAKIPKEDRHHIPLLTATEGILWVVGFRTDERFIATEQTTRILTIEILPQTQNMAFL